MKSSEINNLKHFDTISEMQQELGLPKPLHPLISLLDYSEVEIKDQLLSLNFVMNFYHITYNDSSGCRMKYGQTTYDFNEAGMCFTSPGQSLAGIQSTGDPKGFTLLIHPDFFRGYPLEGKIKNYGFFSYSINESLYLSDKEKNIITNIANIINEELKTSIDDLSQDVLISQVELMLIYSERFYKRQFVTRKNINNDLIGKMELLLDNYFKTDQPMIQGIPTVKYLSENLKVSPRYLGDMLRSITGCNTQQHIHLKLIEKAKEKLRNTDLSISEIAYELGFEHPQSFSKFFRTKTNFSPLEFKQSFN
ncbi:helix-turn-helix transcriptional regulator [Chryseobacterium sp. RG1]|uniref:Helix-turn-helix transcriptional regulator n=1 Tax=Chryseobacterium tagetis TaxID=2801334 RepID=A0ABS8A5L0_9FLAO|nr:helix-turn-helix transcriptional regulator [Chryseobacterium tagetis]MCA6067981.1 helix-turn-helix transcriptional regulator [Chryseobacterium tagetis]